MNNEEIQKKMDLIIEQQAQFAADIQRSKEIQEAEANLWREKYNSLTDAMTTVVGWIGKLAQGQTELTEAQKRTEAQVAETNERLNVFINVVERYINEHRNGQARSGNEEPEPPK